MRFRNVPPQDIRALPNYTLLEASHYLLIAPRTLKDWVLGREYPVRAGAKRSRPLIPPAQEKSPLLLSFINLVEAHVLHAIRHKHGVTLQTVRRALDWGERHFGGRHPLATQEFKTDGVDLFIERLGKLFIASREGQVALREAFERHLARVEHDEEGLARRLFPFTRPDHGDQPKMIEINPAISFGRPVIVGTGIPTTAIAERFLAGETMEHLAQDYRRALPEIEEVIRCESSRA